MSETETNEEKLADVQPPQFEVRYRRVREAGPERRRLVLTEREDSMVVEAKSKSEAKRIVTQTEPGDITEFISIERVP